MEKCRSIHDIVTAVTNAVAIEHQRLALRDAFGHPEIRAVASSIGINLEEVLVELEIMSNIKSLIAAIYDTCKSNNANGTMNTDAHAFVTAISMSVCQTPPTTPEVTQQNPPPARRQHKSHNVK